MSAYWLQETEIDYNLLDPEVELVDCNPLARFEPLPASHGIDDSEA